MNVLPSYLVGLSSSPPSSSWPPAFSPPSSPPFSPPSSPPSSSPPSSSPCPSLLSSSLPLFLVAPQLLSLLLNPFYTHAVRPEASPPSRLHRAPHHSPSAHTSFLLASLLALPPSLTAPHILSFLAPSMRAVRPEAFPPSQLYRAPLRSPSAHTTDPQHPQTSLLQPSPADLPLNMSHRLYSYPPLASPLNSSPLASRHTPRRWCSSPRPPRSPHSPPPTPHTSTTPRSRLRTLSSPRAWGQLRRSQAAACLGG